MPYSPRNPWGALLHAFDRDPALKFERARLIEAAQYNKEMDKGVVDALLAALDVDHEGPIEPKKYNLISDLTGSKDAALRVPFRKVEAFDPPSPYPFDFTLPPRAATRNDTSLFHQLLASNRGGTFRPQNLLLVHAAKTRDEAEHFVRAIASQRGNFDVRVVISLAEAPDSLAEVAQANLERVEVVPFPLLSAEMDALVQEAIFQEDGSAPDGVGFLSGEIALGGGCLERASRLLSVSDSIVQGLWPLTDCPPKTTAYATSSANAFKSRYPFRELKGCNMLVPAQLLRRTGGLDARFASIDVAAKEMGWRCFNLGAWFSPLLVGSIQKESSKTSASDVSLFKSLSPNAWDRSSGDTSSGGTSSGDASSGHASADGLFEVPKVSIYIPAYNAAKYITDAVGSVLDQDVDDIEVCIAVDGSPDNTLQVLEQSFGSDPRVRFEDGVNGGIGHASNRAIRMSRGMYVGQLDSDDRLVPGAVRRLMTYLDENPEVACAYGSCERIDADGGPLGAEYSWPEFTREKMMVTSIAHHFRMFRRAAWERTETFRTDIINAVDYDIFLKLMETGRFHHIDEIMYQRRWHGENTSIVNEKFQTQNAYHVQREALKRVGLRDFWDIKVRDPKEPRRITYARDNSKPRLLFWPDYSRANPYQHLLYNQLGDSCEVLAGPISMAANFAKKARQSGPHIFHLHWTNFLFVYANDATQARANVEAFLRDMRAFKEAGGRIIWTVHNLVSHESPYLDLEKRLINEVIALADTIHVHSAASVSEIREHFDIPREKVRVAPHGSYLGVYSDYIDKPRAREALSLQENDEVAVFAGQVRPYKGIEELIAAFQTLATSRPNLKLIIGGEVKYDGFDKLFEHLPGEMRERIIIFDRFLDESELQVLYRAADIAVYPYTSILTSGSMLLALSFGVPTVVPAVGMTSQVLNAHQPNAQKGGIAYDGSDPSALVEAMRTMLDQSEQASIAAFQVARDQQWVGLSEIVSELI